MELITNKGENLQELAEKGKVLLIFLRHFGCTFCRETMCDIERNRTAIESEGIKIVLVHMTATHLADRYLDIYNLGSVSHISDPEKELYASYGLKKGSFAELFGFRSAIRTFFVAIFKGHLPGSPVGDPKQMPGIFLLKNNKIISQVNYSFAGQKPNFKNFLVH